MKQALLDKISGGAAVICVIGLGYVGLPRLISAMNSGYPCIGIDADLSRVDSLNRGESYIGHIDVDDLHTAISGGTCQITDDFAVATSADVVLLCVPTPLSKFREPDLSFVTGALASLSPYLHSGQLVSLESTTYPGTTEELLLPTVNEIGLAVGDDFFLVYSPEREDPGNVEFSSGSIPKVCGGVTDACLEVGVHFYSRITQQVVPVSSTRAAEMTKILENTYRAVNIALVNELKIVADRMDIDIFEVIRAASTKPFGFKAFYPGPGLGGHCIPIDPFYLTWKAREYGLHTRFIELAGEVNTSMPEYVVEKTIYGLNALGKPVNGSKILILGVTYKKNIDDLRESPGIELIRSLSEKGASISYHDPHVSELNDIPGTGSRMYSVEWTETTIRRMDCVIIATDHDHVDYSLLEKASLVIDSRGIFSPITDQCMVIRA
ncbi:MAG: nucleotide sugar dehydrogenase [Gammaproteobacteria bacterium]|nr:nucleotide sugar dehydrogenase [Gammaproteobacteria bacterium]